jgi:membrane-associated phospholipid phosphatase
MRYILYVVTDLGDSARLLPASTLVALYFLYFRALGISRLWVLTLLLCAALTVALKVAFFTCGAALPLLGLRSPSGHTSLSMTFYGCVALMMTGDRERGARVLALAAATLLVLAVAASRVVLHIHSLPEVVLGLIVGALCVAWFARRYLARPSLALPWQWALVGAGVLALVTHGTHWDFEWLVGRIATLLRASVPVCA